MIQGCPQGSSLSGLNFSIYLNGIKAIISLCKFVFYCDDLVLYCTGKNIDEVNEKLQKDIDHLQDWCRKNNMKINIKKTKCMVFGSKHKDDKLNININNEILENVKNFKYLGITLNEKLSYTEHYEKVCKEMTSRMYMLQRYKKCFSPRWRHIFCTSLVISKLEYCLPIWGDLSTTKFNRINNILLRTEKLVISPSQIGKPSKVDRLEQLNWLMCNGNIFGTNLHSIHAFHSLRKGKVNERQDKRMTLFSPGLIPH